tara:strand:- start:3879 stop:4202 length:324 start_codon:yes stop_codon:yes gene_type:complete
MDAERKAEMEDSVGDLMVNIRRRAEFALGQIEMKRDLSWYSIAAAAREAGENPLAMWRAMRYWEGRNPTVKTFARLADCLGVDLQWLLGGGMDKVVWKGEATWRSNQ